MASDVAIEFPTADVKALMQQIKRASKMLNIPLGRAVRMAGNMLGRTMGTSTRVPKRNVKAKKREIREIKGEKSARGKKKFEVITWKRGRKDTFTVYARNKREVSRMPQVRISKYGLAKMTWVRIASRLGQGGSSGGALPGAKRAARDAGKVEARLRGDDPYVKLINQLSYAIPALQGGENEVNTAMERAARGLAKSIDKQLDRMAA